MSLKHQTPVKQPLGPVMRDVPGLTLTEEDKERLLHPNLGGVVLFAENYASPDQLAALVKSIHALRDPALMVCVDQEGGRVQRFRDGFVRIPPMAALGQRYDSNPAQAKRLVIDAAFVLASELVAHNIDLSFAPVLDLSLTDNPAIGDRAFHADPHIVSELAALFVDTLHAVGLPAIGKHFPGHGGVGADSHVELPIEHRSLDTLEHYDLKPYEHLISNARLDGVMTAHVHYQAIESAPPTFSSFWIQRQLREKLGFTGVVFSDDLHMQGAVDVYASAADRAQAALSAGCDVLLMCRDVQAADAMCEASLALDPQSTARLEHLAKVCRQRRRLSDTVVARHTHKETGKTGSSAADLGSIDGSHEWEARVARLTQLLT